eukprot:CAMPEP_0194492638 /NCGR_PEP_ID=MMETSP0253-20130528/11126_1 /TAXON_ID=2966 /ORGANISM="Noctiluca scintillans" /LENGTH=319 /DNA_ID=CAMNT_0039333531 /DNA_START=111 /DNA_END=1069 /DNA_ORIENTATION=-
MGDQEVSICAACPADNQDEVTQVCKRWKITKAFSQAIDAGANFSAKHWLSQVALAVAWLVEERCATRANIVCIEGGRWCGHQMGQQEVLCQAVRAELKSADFPIRVKWMPIQDFLDGAGDVGKTPVSRDYLAQMAAELYGDDSNTEPVASAGCEFYNICDPDAKERKGESRSSTSPRAFKTAPRVALQGTLVKRHPLEEQAQLLPEVVVIGAQLASCLLGEMQTQEKKYQNGELAREGLSPSSCHEPQMGAEDRSKERRLAAQRRDRWRVGTHDLAENSRVSTAREVSDADTVNSRVMRREEPFLVNIGDLPAALQVRT